MRQRGLATASSPWRPWRTTVTRTGAEGDSNGVGRRERVGEKRKEQTMLWARAIGLRCSGRDELCRQTGGTRQRPRRKRWRRPASMRYNSEGERAGVASTCLSSPRRLLHVHAREATRKG